MVTRERRSLISGPPPGMGFRPDSPLSRRERALQNAKSLSPPFVGDQQPPGFQSSQEKAEDKARTDAASPAPSADRTCRSKSPPPSRLLRPATKLSPFGFAF